LVDGVHAQNISQTILAESNNTTTITWTAVYGAHTLSFIADSLNNVSEANETNNEFNLSVFVQDATSPSINEIITPDSVYVSATLPIQVNATDNVNISEVNATLDGTPVSLTYNSSSGLYEGSTTAPAFSGVYDINITAVDTNGLNSERQQSITINPSEADLTLSASDIVLTPPDPEEPELLEVNVTIRNEGGTDAGDFVVRFSVNGDTEDKNLSVAKASSNSTSFNWTSIYSNHTITVTADYNNDITEANESNNVFTKEIFVLDIVPPEAPNVSASPDNWTTQTTHTISWDAVTDTNGIDHYEYQIDYGDWTSTELNTSFATSAQAEGIHTVYVRAVDTPGNLGYQGNISLYIDNTNPNTPILREWHSGNDWTLHDTPYYSWTDPGDVGSGVTSYVGELDGSTVELNDSQSYHANVTSGNHTFKVYSQDELQQNSSWSNNITVYIDITEPSDVNISSDTHPDNTTWYNNNTPVFNFTTSDQHSGVYGFYYVVDKNESTVPDEFMGSWTTNSSAIIDEWGGVNVANASGSSIGLTDGEWYIHVLAKDNVGNLGNATHYLFKVDTTAPGLINNTPENNSVASTNPPTIQANYTDNHVGVDTSTIILELDGDDVTASATINTTTTIYTPPSSLSDGQHTVVIQLGDLVGNLQNYTWNFNVTGGGINESQARTAIEQGINNSVLNNQTPSTDQQIYISYINTTQMLATFDKVATEGNQTWAFNYISENESFSGMIGLYNNSLTIWENQSLTEAEITQQVQELINNTKW